MSKEYNVIVEQYKNISNHYWFYDITINGKLQWRVQNQQPKEYTNVKVYAGNPWNNPFNSTYGTVWGLKINDVQIGNLKCN